jgi:hypothetical protein
VIEPEVQTSEVFDEFCRCLSGDFDIEHSTFHLEGADRSPLERRAHA